MIAVIDICGNNFASLMVALQRLGYPAILTHDRHIITNASHVILPGVGAAKPAMAALTATRLVDTLRKASQPLLGICLGMQLLFDESAEGDVAGLGLLTGRVTKLSAQPALPVPHMGWNQLQWQQDSPLRQGINANDFVYFVHSYAATTPDYQVASCDYGQRFSAIVQHRNIYGMQFHPEKSARPGLALLHNFLQLEK